MFPKKLFLSVALFSQGAQAFNVGTHRYKHANKLNFCSPSHPRRHFMTKDPFQDFDPRNSPHSYSANDDSDSNKSDVRKSKGSGSMDITRQFSSKRQPSRSSTDTYLDTITDSNAKGSLNENIETEVKQSKNIFDDFDPRISPHMYPNGISSSTSSSISSSQTPPKASKIGILLIDHGSRKSASNELLHTLAETYQKSSKCPPHFTVKAAHMELASPSIEDALTEFILEEQITQVICHPYFISPKGRHVTEDIPFLVEEAKSNIVKKVKEKGGNQDGQNIQIIVTAPTGSRLHGMVSLISEIVNESVKKDLQQNVWGQGQGQNGANSNELVGFFGDIQKMMEEQLSSEE